MGVIQNAPPHPPRFIRKLIGGREYCYEQSRDVIYSGQYVPSAAYDRTQGLSQAVDLCIELTTKCNFTCSNCFSQSRSGEPGVTADIAKVRDAIQAGISRLLRVCITGGEPLLHPRIEELLDLPALYEDCGFVLSTNGAANAKRLPHIQRYPWLVSISLHGPKEIHNAYTNSNRFAQVERAVRKLATTNVVHLYCVLSELLSPSDIDWLLKFRDDAGAAFLRFIVPRPSGRFIPFSSSNIVRAVEERLDDKSGLKLSASLTSFISADGLERMTN